MSFIDSIVDQHKEYESPISFWYWSALASVSAVLKDNVFIDRYIYKLYPNIYVMLHADSGIKKGPPISMARKLTKNLAHCYVGRSSIQGILKDMGSTQSMPGGRFLDKTKAFICSSELTSSIVDDAKCYYDKWYHEFSNSVDKHEIKDPTGTLNRFGDSVLKVALVTALG